MLDPQVEKFYHKTIAARAFFTPVSDISVLRQAADAAFNDTREITDIYDCEESTISFRDTLLGTPRYRLKAKYESQRRFAEPILNADVPDMTVRIYRPHEITEPLPVVLYFHGGGFILHNVRSHDALCRKLAKSWDVIVISAEYRLAPETRYPGYIQDGWALLSWVRDHAEDLQIDPTRIILSGDSAGAAISASVSRLEAMCDIDPAIPRIHEQVLFYGTFGTLPDHESHSMMAYGGGDYVLPRAMIEFFSKYTAPEGLDPDDPFFFAGKGILPEGMPKSIVITAGCDPLRDDGEAYAASLKRSGADVTAIRIDGMMHGFLLYWHKFTRAEKLLDELRDTI